MSTSEPGATPTLPDSSPAPQDPSRRATLVRAGLASAVVLGSLQPGRALAMIDGAMGGVGTMSMWSSMILNPAGPLPSQRARLGTMTVDSPDNWKGKDTYPNFPIAGNNTPAANTRFADTTDAGETRISAGFNATVAPGLNAKTLKEVLRSTAPDQLTQLARYCITMMLYAGNPTRSARDIPVSKEAALFIWMNKGKWTPVSGGPEWSLSGTLDYFNYICYGNVPSHWPKAEG